MSMGKTMKICSEVLGEERAFHVFLPEGYDESQEHYPVMYVLDGERLFDPVSAIVDYYIRTFRIPPMVVVGVVNTDRNRDFTPTKGRGARGPQPSETGGAPTFLRFLREELVPDVEGRYRVRDYRALVGHSHGELFTVYTLLAGPSLFEAYVAISPTLCWDGGVLLGIAEEFFANRSSLRKLLFMASEPVSGNNEKSIEAFLDLLKTGPPRGLEWEYRRYEEADHMDVPLRSLPDGLDFLFSGIIQER